MDLLNETPLSYGNYCFACRQAGTDWRIWPLEYTAYCTFNIYVKIVNLLPGNQYHGSHRRDILFCTSHAQALYNEWWSLILQELRETEAFYRWIDRTET